jgi:hypothetical protein
MKDKSIGNDGFLTIEIVIALAILSSALVSGMYGIYSGQYWKNSSNIKLEAIYENKTKSDVINELLLDNFYNSTSTKFTIKNDPCNQDSFCYETNVIPKEISPCLKNIEINTFWKINNYPTTSIENETKITNTVESIKLGGDCLVNTPIGLWKEGVLSKSNISSTSPKQHNSVDVFADYIYSTASDYPTIHIYKKEVDNIKFINSFDIKINNYSVYANSIDIVSKTNGKTYAFLTLATSTKQFAVIDVTDLSNIELVNLLSLRNVNQSGSFPQGNKVFVYGNRAYVTTRETSGFEFHIFDIENVENIFEVGNGFELNRTVNDLLVRDQKIDGLTKRVVFLASDSNLKELSVLDVTNDVISEISSYNLPGNQDALSLYTSGEIIYLGRSSNTSGPELYAINIRDPRNPTILGQGEVSANINTIKASGDYIFLGTNRSNETFQVWDREYSNWNNILNSSRLQKYNFSNLYSFDLAEDSIVLVNNSSVVDKIELIKGYE